MFSFLLQVLKKLWTPQSYGNILFSGNTGDRTEGSDSIPLDTGEEAVEEHLQGHTKEGPWVLWAPLGAEGFTRQPGSHSHTQLQERLTLIMLINSGGGNQAQICAPSSHCTKANPSGSTALPKGKGDQSDFQRVEIPGLLPTIRARSRWNTPAQEKQE